MNQGGLVKIPLEIGWIIVGSFNHFINIAKDVGKKVGVSSFCGDRVFCAAYGERSLNTKADVKNLL